jgi:hypothetical protein
VHHSLSDLTSNYICTGTFTTGHFLLKAEIS